MQIKMKAIIKTIIDVMKFVGALLGFLMGAVLALYLYVKIPVWILNSAGITEHFVDVRDTGSMTIIYFVEFAILCILVIAVLAIRAVYLNNLELQYEMAETELISTSISCVSDEAERLFFDQIEDAGYFYYNDVLYMKISQQDLQERSIESVNAISIINGCFLYFDKDTIVTHSTKEVVYQHKLKELSDP